MFSLCKTIIIWPFLPFVFCSSVMKSRQADEILPSFVQDNLTSTYPCPWQLQQQQDTPKFTFLYGQTPSYCLTTRSTGAALFNPAFIILSTQLLLKAMPLWIGSWTWHTQTLLRASNQLWFHPLVTMPVIILKSEHSNFNNILLQVAVIMSSPFYAFYRLDQEWLSDTRILLSLTGSECFWRRWKTTHDSLRWAMEAGDSPWLLPQNAEETIHSKCTFLRTWFLFPCDCLHSLMLLFIFCWSFLRILNLVFNIQCHCNPTTWLCWHDKSVFLRNPKQPQSFFSPLCQRPWSTSSFLFFLKLESNTATISEWNLWYMSDQKVTSSVGRNKLPTHVVRKLCSQWQKEHLSTAVILQNKHFFYSQFPQIYIATHI